MGEAKFGLTKGVLSTRSYWYGDGGKGEIVEIGFDPAVVSYAELIRLGGACGCADKVFAVSESQLKIAKQIVGDRAASFVGKGRPDKQPKYYLYVSDLRSIPMTELQAVRINAVMDDKQSVAQRVYEKFLSPRQLTLLAEVRSRKKVEWPNLVGVSLREGWKLIEKARAAK